MMKIAKHLSLPLALHVPVSLHGRLEVEETESLLPSSGEKVDSFATSFPRSDPVAHLLSQISWVTRHPFHISSTCLLHEIPTNRWGLSRTWRWLKPRVWGSCEGLGVFYAGVLYRVAAFKFLSTGKHGCLLSLKRCLSHQWALSHSDISTTRAAWVAS